MSNKQEVTIDASGNPNKTELWVVRMLAKVTLRFKNPSATPLVINDITISDITKIVVRMGIRRISNCCQIIPMQIMNRWYVLRIW